MTDRCICGDLLTQHYVKDLRCANPACDCGQYESDDELDELIADHENAGHLAPFDECYPCQRTPSRVRGDR